MYIFKFTKKKVVLAKLTTQTSHHSPAEINLLGSLGNMIISLSVRVYALTPTKDPTEAGY